MTKYVSEWLQRAEDDLKTIEVLLREGVALRMVCFHAQQAAEKCMKGYLAYHEKHVRKIHELDELLAECEQFDAAFRTLREDALYLTQFYVDTRYPEVLGDVSSAEATRAQEAAKRVCDFVKQKIQ